MKGPKELYFNIFNELIPFNKYIGLELAELEDGFAKALIKFKPELVGDRRIMAVHGIGNARPKIIKKPIPDVENAFCLFSSFRHGKIVCA